MHSWLHQQLLNCKEECDSVVNMQCLWDHLYSADCVLSVHCVWCGCAITSSCLMPHWKLFYLSCVQKEQDYKWFTVWHSTHASAKHSLLWLWCMAMQYVHHVPQYSNLYQHGSENCRHGVVNALVANSTVYRKPWILPSPVTFISFSSFIVVITSLAFTNGNFWTGVVQTCTAMVSE